VIRTIADHHGLNAAIEQTKKQVCLPWHCTLARGLASISGNLEEAYENEGRGAKKGSSNG
jgi:hypothetical protein